MIDKRKVTHSFTAYQCRICPKYRTDNLLTKSEENEDPIDLAELLDQYFAYIKRSKIDEYTSRTILLEQSKEETDITDSVKRIVVHPKAGKANEDFTVVAHDTNAITRFDGSKNSAIYSHSVFCYLKGEENVFIFHRYGQSGCKTAFQNTFNTFLSSKGLVCHLDVLVSDGMFEGHEKYHPEKLSLITTYEDISSDPADNIRKKKRKKIEQEVIIALNAPKAVNIVEYLRNITKKQPTITELKSVLIKDSFTDQFDDAKLTLKFGQVRRKISLSEFSGLIAEYDITSELEYAVDGSVKKESLYALADRYALTFLEDKE